MTKRERDEGNQESEGHEAKGKTVVTGTCRQWSNCTPPVHVVGRRCLPPW